MDCISKVNKTYIHIRIYIYINLHLQTVETEEADTWLQVILLQGLFSSSCTENFRLKFMYDVIMPIAAMHTWPVGYDGGLLVVKHLKELCDVMKISSTEHFIDNH